MRMLSLVAVVTLDEMQLLKLAAFISFYIVLGQTQDTGNTTRILSRRKRYMAFPDGSSVSAAICLTIGVIGNPSVDYLSWAVNWGVAYNLPNYAWARRHASGFQNDTKAIIQRRSRRDLYEKLELAMDNMGFQGNACVSRALCEGAQFIRGRQQRKGNMVEEIIKTILRFPSTQLGRDEPPVHHHYASIQRRAKRSAVDCSQEYSDCPFSPLELALGKYSMPRTHGSSTGSFLFM